MKNSYLLKEFLKIFVFGLYKIIRGTAVAIIEILTYEPKKKCVLTPRKAKRIRRLTQMKIKCNKMFPKFYEFIEMDGYYNNLERRLGNNVM